MQQRLWISHDKVTGLETIGTFFFNYRSSTLSSPHVAPIGVTEATKLSLLSSQRDEYLIVQLLVRLQQIWTTVVWISQMKQWKMFLVVKLRLLRTTTIAINHRTNIVRPSAIFVQKPFQNMHSIATMPTSLTDNDGIVKRVWLLQENVKRRYQEELFFYIPLLNVYSRSASRAASWTIDKVAKQTEHLGRSRPQFEQVVGCHHSSISLL